MNGDEIDNVALDSINQSIVALQNFSICFGFILVDKTAKQRIGLQEFDLVDQFLPEATSSHRRISGNIIQQRFKIFEGLIRPNQSSHFFNRCFADS